MHKYKDFEEIKIKTQKKYEVVWKRAKDVCYQNISKNEFDFLKLLKKKSFSELNDFYSNKEEDLENIIASTINSSWIVGSETIS